MRIDAVQTIKDRLTMQDVIQYYGFSVNRAGFMCCPFHGEKTASLKVYKGKGGWHCFGCGASGDEISFVQQLFGLSFQETLKKIDVDFSLNIYGEHTFEELRRSHRQQQAMKAKREREKIKKQQAEEKFQSVYDEFMRLYENMSKYAPKTLNEEWHPLFVESLTNLAYQEYLLEMASIARCNK